MKWFFALSAITLDHRDHNWVEMIRAAVCSARRNTWLRPHFIFDGPPSDMTRELELLGVTVIHHRVSLYDRMAAEGPAFPLAIASGSYLRIDIPWIEASDEYVLYTDCDVLFRRHPSITHLRPKYFACAPQMHRGDYNDMNSGVMLINVKGMRGELADFSRYIDQNMTRLGNFDQTALQEFYRNRYDQLPDDLNWKPYWGWNAEAEIVHFHGPKPAAIRKLLTDPAYETNPVWKSLFNQDSRAYGEYLKEWSYYHDQAEDWLKQVRG